MEEKKAFRKFCKQMEREVQQCFPEGMQVEIHKVVKNNGLELDSLAILSEERPVSPNFYLQMYYRQYEKGTDIPALVRQIVEQYQESVSSGEDMQFDVGWKNCEKNIVFRLVSYQRNEKILPDVPHIPFLDLAVLFYVLVKKDIDGIGSVRVDNSLMDRWEIDIGTLLQVARENTQRLFPVRIYTMHSVMRELMNTKADCGIPEEFQEELPFPREPYVITNDSGLNGAAAILYPDTLKETGKILHGDFYLLPSSIHEVLAISSRAAVTAVALEEMVQEVNQSCVAKEEVLSESVYFYEHCSETIRVL